MHKLFLLASLCLAVAACGGEEDEVPLEPTFASIQKNVFDKTCASSACHGDAKEGDLDLRSGKAFDELINIDPDNAVALAAGLKLVTPGDPQKSFLYLKLSSVDDGMGKPMPVGARPLSSEKTNAIKKWIEDGAER